MSALVRLLLAVGLGAISAYCLPTSGLLAATQEIIAFLALLMAGLLPAMILTATILRGGGLSAKRVEEYGRALQLQLRFWAFLFGAAGVATLGIVFAKIFSAAGVKIDFQIFTLQIDEKKLTIAALICAGSGLGVVFQRLRPAYAGLVSLLHLNVNMAKTEAMVHDRTLRDALTTESAHLKETPYASSKPESGVG